MEQRHVAEQPQLLGTQLRALPSRTPAISQHSKEDIQIVSMTSLCQGGEGSPAGWPPGRSTAGSPPSPAGRGLHAPLL